MTPSETLHVDHFSFWYGPKQVLDGITLAVREREITAFIGPSGCGKTTLLRNFNRLHDLNDEVRHTGDIRVGGCSVFDPAAEVIALRRRVGMVFQKTNPFPTSLYENVVFPLRIAGCRDRHRLDEVVERSLREAFLWEEVKDRLHEGASGLSGGQQQRLCIARAIANRPEILLMDEPCASLDPVATLKIEELLCRLRRNYTIVIVTHNLEQARRVADRTAFFYQGRLIEAGPTLELFTTPRDARTEAYVRGRMA